MKKLLLCSVIFIPSLFQTAHAEKAVEENTISYSAKFNSARYNTIYLQGDATFALGDSFGFTVGANNLNLKFSDETDNAQNLRVGGFYRNPVHGRVEIAYQQLFTDEENEGLYSITGEYYFDNWTLGTYVMSDELSELNDLNIYTNIYFTDNIRLEIDLLDASDDSVVSATVNFQAPEYIGNEWQFSLSYGEGFWDNDHQWGIGIKYTPSYNDTLKRFYRNYSTNIKSFFFL
tara:strand:- start:3383 stop:4078 length:696 start_codon:yes stop_codon:yes gene_type:complete